jgi:hypothetical protein
MITARERARALCERGHGYGQAVDPYCAQCRKIAAAMLEERARAFDQASSMVNEHRVNMEGCATLENKFLKLAKAARRGE